MLFRRPSQHSKLSTSLPWQSSFFILICLRIPKSEPTSNGLDCWLIAADAENRLIWRVHLVVGWSHLDLNRLSKQDSLTAGRSVWHACVPVWVTPHNPITPSLVTLSCHSSLCVGLHMTSRVQTSGTISRFTTNQHKSRCILLRKIESLFFLFKQNV